jgi:trans-aconitate methyltransferase
VTNCPLCGSDAFEPVQMPEGSWRICRDCGLGYQHPARTMDEMAEYYANGYRPEGYPREHDRRIWDNRAIRQVDVLKQAGLISADRILDIGCAGGRLLEACGDTFGAEELWGVELNPLDWPECEKRGVNLAQDLDRIVRPFDLLLMSHSLEHFDDPVGFLKTLRSYATQAAWLMIELPGWDTRSAWQDFHYVAFRLPQLTKALEKAGWGLVFGRKIGGVLEAVARVD